MIELNPVEVLPLLVAMLVTGACGGILAGLLGVGGGIVIVPVLYTALTVLDVAPDHRMHISVATSLATIIPTSISSVRAHHARNAIDWSLARSWGVFIVLGALLGGITARYLHSAELTLIFAVIALAVALFMAVRREGSYLLTQLPRGPGGRLVPIGIGGFSTLMGIGGGTLSVPILSACNYPVRRAVATASFFGLLIAVPGMLAFVINGWGIDDRPPFSVGYVNLLGFMLIAPMTIVFAPLGARIAHSIPPQQLRWLFTLFLLITSAKMFTSALGWI